VEKLNERETAYLKSQMLGRVATANAQGQPHVTPVGFRYNEETGTIDIGGYDLSSTKKVRDLEQNPRIAFVVDDLASVKPWRPRGVIVRGTAVVYQDPERSEGGPFGDTWIRIIPSRVISWGLEAPVFAAR
jgi:pyridoxamine 5'-phosphate oxidase family protein